MRSCSKRLIALKSCQMSTTKPHEKVKTVWPHQLGWLRRPELEDDSNQVWELPDGKLYHYKGKGAFTLQIARMPRR